MKRNLKFWTRYTWECTGMVLAVAAVLAVFLNLKKNPDIHIRPKLIRWDRMVVREIYRVGLPSIIMQSIGSVMVFGMNQILIAFTDTATAVFGCTSSSSPSSSCPCSA